MSFVEPPFWALGAGRGYRPLRIATAVVTPPAIEPVSLTEVKNRLRITATADDADLAGLIIAARKQLEKDLGGACLVQTVVDQFQDRPPYDRVMELRRWPLQSVASVKSFDIDDVESTFASTDYLVDTASQPGRIILNGDASWPTGLRLYKAIAVRHTCGFSGAAAAVTSITRASATATVTTTAAHGYATGNRITLAGASQAEYNGTFEIVVTGANTFTFAVTGTPASPATGVITVTSLGIPETYLMALMLLIAHWYEHREPVVFGSGATTVPLAYDALISDAPVSMA